MFCSLFFSVGESEYNAKCLKETQHLLLWECHEILCYILCFRTIICADAHSILYILLPCLQQGSGMIHLTGIAGMPWCAKVHTVTALFARLQLHTARCPMIVEIRTDSRRSWRRHMLKSFKIAEMFKKP